MFKQVLVGALASCGAALSFYFTYVMMTEAMTGTALGIVAFALFLQAAQYVYTLPSMAPARWLQVIVFALYLLSVGASYTYLARSAESQTARDARARALHAQKTARHAQQVDALNARVTRAQRVIDDLQGEKAVLLEASRKQISEGYASRARDALDTPTFRALSARIVGARADRDAIVAEHDKKVIDGVPEILHVRPSLFSTLPDFLRVLVLVLMAAVLELVTFASIRTAEIPPRPFKRRTPKKRPPAVKQPLNVVPIKTEDYTEIKAKICEGVYTNRPVMGQIAEQESIPPDVVAGIFKELVSAGQMTKVSGRYTI